MFDFRRSTRDTNGSMVRNTAAIASVIGLFSVIGAGLLSNMTASDDNIRRLAEAVPTTNASSSVRLERSWTGIDQTATATIPKRARKSDSAPDCANMAKIVTTYRTIGPEGEIVTTTQTVRKGPGASACTE
jgi:hypothetical protein